MEREEEYDAVIDEWLDEQDRESREWYTEEHYRNDTAYCDCLECDCITRVWQFGDVCDTCACGHLTGRYGG